jgi:iron complex outermembrane receptor protein
MRLKKLILISTALAGSAPAAYAQTAAPAPAPASADEDARNNRQDDIVVTAQKRSESINDVAEAVTAFTAERRQVIGLTNVADIAKFTPGLSYSAGADRIYLRGVGRQTNTAGSDPGVATYTDGIYDSSTASVGASDFFVERIEVLRGPQGTLYGRNSIGGAINAISKRPTPKLSVEGRATIQNYDSYGLNAAISGPVTDYLRVRVAGSWSDQGKGYFRNLAGGPSEGGAGNAWYVEGQIEADLGPQATLWLKGSTGGSDGRPRSTNFDTPYDYAPFISGALTPSAAFGYLLPGHQAQGSQTDNPGVSNIRDFSADTVSRARVRGNFNGQGQLDIRLDPFDIRVLGGYREVRYEATSDLDNTSMVAYDFPLSPGALCGFVPGCAPLRVFPTNTFGYVEDRSFGSAEINFISNGSGPLKWITGLYFYGEQLDQESHFGAPNQPQLAAPANGPANPSRDFVYAATNLKTASYAAFGQLDWDATETLRLTGGLRYSADEKQATESFRVVCLGCAAGATPDQLGSLTPAIDITSSLASFAPADGIISPTRIDPTTGQAIRVLKDGWSSVTGTAGIQWRPSKDSLVYANYSRGYKSGGFSAGGIIASPRTDSEHINAYQAGIKQQLGPIQLNLAGYYYNYSNLQIPLDIPTPGINLGAFFNLRSAKSYGIEFESQWEVVKGLQLLLSYSYADSSIKSCCYFDGADPSATAPGAQPEGPIVGTRRFQNVNGEELPYISRHKVAANAAYTHDVGPGSVTLSASYTWRDKMWSSVFNRSYYRIPSSEKVDARLLWTQKDSNYRVIFFVQNLFNTQGFDSVGGIPGSSTPSPYVLPLTTGYPVNRNVGVELPRTYGVQVSFAF